MILASKLAPPWQNINKTRKLHSVPHLWYWDQRIADLGLMETSNDVCYEYVWTKNYKVNVDSFDGKAKHRSHSEVTVYTDGSRMEMGVGAGFVVYRKKQVVYYESFKLEDYATVFQAEIMAIKKSLEYIMECGEAKFVKILSDSQAALMALDKEIVTSKLVLQTVE